MLWPSEIHRLDATYGTANGTSAGSRRAARIDAITLIQDRLLQRCLLLWRHRSNGCRLLGGERSPAGCGQVTAAGSGRAAAAAAAKVVANSWQRVVLQQAQAGSAGRARQCTGKSAAERPPLFLVLGKRREPAQ